MQRNTQNSKCALCLLHRSEVSSHRHTASLCPSIQALRALLKPTLNCSTLTSTEDTQQPMSRREQRPRVGFNLVRGLRGPVTANAAAIGATVPVALDSRTSIDTPGTETPPCPPDVQAESSGIQDDSNGMLLNLGANAAQGMIHPVMGGLAFGAQFAPVPLLPAAIRVIDDIITAFENVKTHRYLWCILEPM